MKPAVYAGEPENKEDYRYAEVDGINIYIPNEEELKEDEISIKVKGFGPFKQFIVDGI